MAFDLSSITTGVCRRAPRIILLGVEKIGKSSFAAQSNSPVFLPIKGEEGIDALNVAKTPTCNAFAEAASWLQALMSGEHEYQTSVIDSVSTMEPLIWQYVCEKHKVESIEKVGGGYGKGYTESLAVWRQLTEMLDALRSERNMASILIGHVKVKRFDDPAGPSYDQYQFDINDRAANLLFRWADCILFCNTKVVVQSEDTGFDTKNRGIDITGGQRFLFTQKRPAHPGGGRGAYGHIPYELPLSWEAFQSAVAAAMSQ